MKRRHTAAQNDSQQIKRSGFYFRFHNISSEKLICKTALSRPIL
jgi:hypothetical protein